MLLLIAACTFGTVSLLLLGLTMRSEHEIIQERMERHAQTGDVMATSMEQDLEIGFRDRVVLPVLRSLAAFGMRFTPGGAIQGVEQKLETAGRPWNLGAKEFIGLKVLSIGVLTLAGIGAARYLGDRPAMSLLMLVIFIFIGVILPDYALQQVINTRQTRIRKALADTLDLLTVSVEAGLGLDGAMQKVTEKLPGPLSEEMGRALREMQVGKPRTDALKDMSRRTKVPELIAFVAAVCQADQLGVSIAKVLRVQGETLRSQRSQVARETAAKLPVKMLFPLVFFIFPAIFVVIAGPAAVNIYRALSMVK